MPRPPRAGRARAARLLVLGGLAGLAAVPWSQPPAAHAACAPPSLSIEGAPEGVVALRRGQEITVTGRGFVDCGRGGGGPFPGCGRPDPGAGPAPMAGVELELVGGRVTRRATTVGTADAGTAAQDRLGRVTWTVVVPDGQATGPSTLQAEGPSGFPVGVGVQVKPAE